MDYEERTNGVLSQKEFIKKGQELIEKGDRSFLDAKIDNEVMQIMLFTSGTTAMSKAVMLNQYGIATNIWDMQKTETFLPTDTSASPVKINTHGALNGSSSVSISLAIEHMSLDIEPASEKYCFVIK